MQIDLSDTVQGAAERMQQNVRNFPLLSMTLAGLVGIGIGACILAFVQDLGIIRHR